MYFDLLLLEAMLEVCLFGTHFLEILAFSFLEEDEDSVSTEFPYTLLHTGVFLGAQCRTVISTLYLVLINKLDPF